jgi:methylthioribose-1-phosphate isomerase
MQRGEIDLVIVGSDRTLGRTGEVANKIGTYTKAVLARGTKFPFTWRFRFRRLTGN